MEVAQCSQSTLDKLHPQAWPHHGLAGWSHEPIPKKGRQSSTRIFIIVGDLDISLLGYDSWYICRLRFCIAAPPLGRRKAFLKLIHLGVILWNTLRVGPLESRKHLIKWTKWSGHFRLMARKLCSVAHRFLSQEDVQEGLIALLSEDALMGGLCSRSKMFFHEFKHRTMHPAVVCRLQPTESKLYFGRASCLPCPNTTSSVFPFHASGCLCAHFTVLANVEKSDCPQLRKRQWRTMKSI